MSDSEESERNEVEVFGDWGQKAKDYYGGSDLDEVSDEEDLIGMEQEAAQIAKKRQQQLQKAKKALGDDFSSDEEDGDSDEDGKDDEEEEEEEDDSEDEDIAAETNVKKNLRKAMFGGADGTDDVKLSASLSAEQKAILIKKKSPELMMLLKEFQAELRFLRDRLHPAMQTMHSQKAKKEKYFSDLGMEYIDMRIQFAYSYLSKLSFYLHLKQQEVRGTQAPSPTLQLASFSTHFPTRF